MGRRPEGVTEKKYIWSNYVKDLAKGQKEQTLVIRHVFCRNINESSVQVRARAFDQGKEIT